MNTKKRKNNLTKRAIIISLVLIILSLCIRIGYIYGKDYYIHNYAKTSAIADLNKYPVMGVDVSAHQGKIDWKLVSESKVSFAFIKATEGNDFVDKLFANNFKQAKQHNIIVGAYHFFRFNKDGRMQAKNFIKNAKLTNNDMPPVVDFEASYGNRLNKYKTNYIQNQLLKCLREMEKHYGCKPIIYTNVETYNKYIKGSFDEYPLWLCKLSSEPTKQTKWKFWQYSHKGSIAGIKGSVDVNVYNGSYKELQNFIANSYKKKVKKNAKTKNNSNNRQNSQHTSSKT